jgi:hypothetical protein
MKDLALKTILDQLSMLSTVQDKLTAYHEVARKDISDGEHELKKDITTGHELKMGHTLASKA